MASYSNLTAARALVKASLQAITKSPSAIVFGIAFPLVFILVFGFLSDSGPRKIPVAIQPGSDTTNAFFQEFQHLPQVRLQEYRNPEDLKKAMSEGDVAAEIGIQDNGAGTMPRYRIALHSASTQPVQVAELHGLLRNIALRQDPAIEKQVAAVMQVRETQETVRAYKTIDFILPGQLGFSLLAGSIFGTAFVFFNLRQTLVLKRFFATPVRREVIVVSEGIARMVFQLLTAIVIIGVGYWVFGFTLVHGAWTAIQLLFLSALGVMVFMGFGFVISSLAKSESTIPPLSNLVTLPQFLLAGTFFPVSVFPKWLQPISNALPLTYLNDAMRQVAFYGAGLGEIKWQIIALLLWGIVIYALAARVFKWE